MPWLTVIGRILSKAPRRLGDCVDQISGFFVGFANFPEKISFRFLVCGRLRNLRTDR